MNIIAWIIQIILALIFLMAGGMKSTQPKEKLEGLMAWTKDFSIEIIRFIGISEFLGGIGLILPQLTGIAPILTPLAASGLGVIMILASIYHFQKGEYKEISINMILLVLSAIVAIIRF